MTPGRLHLLSQAALCFQQAGLPIEAARCREKAGEPVAAAELFRAAGELTEAARCYRRAGRIADAVSCLLILGRPQDAADLWESVDEWLDAAWVLAIDANQPNKARRLLAKVQPDALGETLRHRLATAVCCPVPKRQDALVAVLADIEDRLRHVAPASEQARLVQWSVRAADRLRRPDLASRVFATAYRCRVPGCVRWWREWARTALGGTAGIPERDV